MFLWVLSYVLLALLFWWVVYGGGAAVIEGWLAFLLLDVLSLDWTAEQIRLYCFILWCFATVVFIVGFISVSVRQAYWSLF